MDIVLVCKRVTWLPTRTFSELWHGDVSMGHILEDKVRDNEPFVLGETAIPYGRYRLAVTFSNRFKKQMIQVFNIHGGNKTFHNINIDACGIRIHGGNTEADSLGCLIYGKHRQGDEKVYDCKDVNDKLIADVLEWDKAGVVYLDIVK